MGRLLIVAQNSTEAKQAEGFAQALTFPFDVLTLSDDADLTSSAEKLLVADASPATPDIIAKTITKIASGYSHIAAVSSMAAKDLLPRVAALLDCAMVTDATELIDPKTFRRAMYAGSVLTTVEAASEPIVLTFRPSGFPKTVSGEVPARESFEMEAGSRAKIVENKTSAGARPDLSQAKVVVSGGRPLRDASTFETVIGGFADAFGGAVGATRAAVDAGIAANESQVGQTGKIVAPDLYVAAGISGSTQHVAGIKDSKLIVAINKDPDAPIFGVADLGLVGDLFDVLPKLQAALQQK
jgi:electron transfer flavoprotein alpha subunit